MQSAKLVDIARRSYVAARVELTTLELEKGGGELDCYRRGGERFNVTSLGVDSWGAGIFLFFRDCLTDGWD